MKTEREKINFARKRRARSCYARMCRARKCRRVSVVPRASRGVFCFYNSAY